MKKTLTKSDIIQAIEEEEHLSQGWWVTRPLCTLLLSECKVCAVGAVVRLLTDSVYSAPVYAQKLAYNCEDHELWHGLSSAFENEPDPETGRIAAIHYVQDHFPDTLNIDLEEDL